MARRVGHEKWKSGKEHLTKLFSKYKCKSDIAPKVNVDGKKKIVNVLSTGLMGKKQLKKA